MPRVEDLEEFKSLLERPLPNMPKNEARKLAASGDNAAAWAALIGG